MKYEFINKDLYGALVIPMFITMVLGLISTAHWFFASLPFLYILLGVFVKEEEGE